MSFATFKVRMQRFEMNLKFQIAFFVKLKNINNYIKVGETSTKI